MCETVDSDGSFYFISVFFHFSGLILILTVITSLKDHLCTAPSVGLMLDPPPPPENQVQL